MKQFFQRLGGVRLWLLVLAIGGALGLGIGRALAQSTGSTPDLGTLIQQFSSLFGGQTGVSPTTDTSGTGTGTGTTTSQPSGDTSGARQPIVTNQFNTTQNGSLHERSPGVWIQNGIAEHMGTLDTLTGDVPEEQPNFFKATFDEIALGIIKSITDLISGLNVLAASAGGLPPPSTTTQPATVGTIDNPTTSGAGTSTPIQ